MANIQLGEILNVRGQDTNHVNDIVLKHVP